MIGGQRLPATGPSFQLAVSANCFSGCSVRCDWAVCVGVQRSFCVSPRLLVSDMAHWIRWNQWSLLPSRTACECGCCEIDTQQPLQSSPPGMVQLPLNDFQKHQVSNVCSLSCQIFASSHFWLSTATGVSRSDKGVCFGWVAHSLLLEEVSVVPGLCDLLPSF